MTRPTLDAFRERAERATVIPVLREIAADWWTPVHAFHLLARSEPHTFLLESVEGGERIGRYSFLGRRPFLVARSRGDDFFLSGKDASLHEGDTGTPPERLRKIFARYRTEAEPGLPPFTSGAVGYFGYDSVRWTETLPREARTPVDEDDMVLLFLQDVAAFDHLRRRLTLVANARVKPGTDADAAYGEAVERLDAMEAELREPLAPPEPEPSRAPDLEVRSNMEPETYRNLVRRAKEYIDAGDVFQVVLSQRFTVNAAVEDLSLYRSLRAVNPSPYMFLLRLDGWSAVGSSPEPLLQVQGKQLRYRPIAGTIARSGDEAEDRRRAEVLSHDPKERAEHIMLVDLGRNDLGRSAVSGTVEVEELMAVEKYSHVMHLVSALTAELRPDLGPLDALYACFPAGTVSGAPKVRAMEIIEELEPDRRGLYSGAVGYLDFSGNLDTCIALRTMVVRPREIAIQAGAGIVADSDPDREYNETKMKAEALVEAVRRAAGGSGR